MSEQPLSCCASCLLSSRTLLAFPILVKILLERASNCDGRALSSKPKTTEKHYQLAMELASPVSHISLLLLSRCPAGVITLINVVPLLLGSLLLAAVAVWAYPGGPAWGSWGLRGAARDSNRRTTIPGPRGLPIVGSLLEMGQAAHLRLAKLATLHHAKRLMAFSLGDTRVVLTCVPSVAKELLSSSAFADRPVKQSAKLLLFERAIGFAPYGDYWRKLRRIAATHLFAPTRLAALEGSRQLETTHLLQSIHESMEERGAVQVRGLLQKASVNNIMKCVFGRRYDFEDGTNEEAAELQRMMREGFELLGACNWNDHLPFLCKWFDFQGIEARCKKLVAQVQVFVQGIVDEHKKAARHGFKPVGPQEQHADSDFVDVMLSLQTDENLSDSDLVAVLWEMIFRGTDTTSILMEWILAEMVLNPDVQARAHAELDRVVGHFRRVEQSDVARLPYLQAIVKEALRVHPPGPLLSWARLATQDADLAGFHVPAGTTAMVNMWAITHDAEIWEEPGRFKPERFLAEEVDVRGSDLRLAPFGAGRRVCPGRALGLATVQLWVARLLQRFEWTRAAGCETVDMSEVLKLSCEMRTPLVASAKPRSGVSSLPNF